MKSASYVLKLTLILFAITAAVALVLGGINALTAAPIAAYSQQKTADAIRVVLPSEAEPAEIPDFADESGMVLLKTDERMYVACGKLYENGLRGGSVKHE